MGDRLRRNKWPRNLGVFVRGRKLAPGEQPTLFQMDGYKYSAFVTTTRTLTPQRLDARHRVHARVEDGVRTTKMTCIGSFGRLELARLPGGLPLDRESDGGASSAQTH
jgi:hypothetical protein